MLYTQLYAALLFRYTDIFSRDNLNMTNQQQYNLLNDKK